MSETTAEPTPADNTVELPVYINEGQFYIGQGKFTTVTDDLGNKDLSLTLDFKNQAADSIQSFLDEKLPVQIHLMVQESQPAEEAPAPLKSIEDAAAAAEVNRDALAQIPTGPESTPAQPTDTFPTQQ